MKKKSALAQTTFYVGVTFFAVVVLAIAAIVVAQVAQRYTLTDPNDSSVRLTAGPIVCTGVHLGKGEILTAAHCLAQLEIASMIYGELKYKVETGLGLLDTEVLWSAPEYDVALLHAPALRTKAATLSCNSLVIGERIFTTGNPLGYHRITTEGRVAGNMAASKDFKEYQLVDLTVAPGNSGGPVFNIKGSFVGIVVAIVPPFNFTFIVPSPTLCKLLGRG